MKGPAVAAAATGRGGRSGRLARTPRRTRRPDLTKACGGGGGRARPGRASRRGGRGLGPGRLRTRETGIVRGRPRGGRGAAPRPPSLTCAARAMARVAADALRLRSSRRRPGPGRTPDPPPREKRPPASAPHFSPGRARRWSPGAEAAENGSSRGAAALTDAGRAHGRPRRALPRTLRRCRKVAPRDVATLPCGARVGGGQLWRPGGRRGASSSPLSAAPSRAAAVSSPPSAAPSAGMRRRAG